MFGWYVRILIIHIIMIIVCSQEHLVHCSEMNHGQIKQMGQMSGPISLLNGALVFNCGMHRVIFDFAIFLSLFDMLMTRKEWHGEND